jgi:hypothetical protein
MVGRANKLVEVHISLAMDDESGAQAAQPVSAPRICSGSDQGLSERHRRVQASTLFCETPDMGWHYRILIEYSKLENRGNSIVRSAPPPQDAGYPTSTHVPVLDSQSSHKTGCHV